MIHIDESNEFLRVDENSEALYAIVMTKEFLERSKQDIYYLKWAIIAIHNALQAFMVLSLRGTCSLGLIDWKKDQIKGLTQHEMLSLEKNPYNGKYIDRKLYKFNDLFKKVKKKTGFEDKSGKITWSVKRLNDLRNLFLHYMPGSWSIEIKLIFYVFNHALKVISFLFESEDMARLHYKENEIDVIRKSIQDCKKIVG